MATEEKKDLVVIGAGPGGYAAAFRAAQLGRQVTLVDTRDVLGGVCLNEGCIPSKAALHGAAILEKARHGAEFGLHFGAPRIDLDAFRARVNQTIGQLTQGLKSLCQRHRVEFVQAEARFARPGQLTLHVPGKPAQLWHYRDVIIATGSQPVSLPACQIDSNRIWTSREALEFREIPEHLAIIGGGIIGLEMATIYHALGSRVTVIELSDQIAAGCVPQAANALAAKLKGDGMALHTATTLHAIEAHDAGLRLHCGGAHEGTLEATHVLQCVGRRANSASLALAQIGLSVNERDEIAVDAQCRTTQAHVYAIGDVTGGPMLAHRASHQGKVAAENACGHHAEFSAHLIPSVAYTHPEIAWVGVTPARAAELSLPCQTTTFPWAASGRNLAEGSSDGFTALYYAPEDHRVIGATIYGENAGELIATVAVAIEMGATLEDIGHTVFAHPTRQESIAFSAEVALGICTDF